MARLRAQADPARHKQIVYSHSLQKRHTRTKKKGETSLTVRVRNERRQPWSYQQGALPNELADSKQFQERKPISIIFLLFI